MVLELENAVPSGFQLNSTYRIIHGLFQGYQVLIYPMESAGQYQIVMQLDVEQSTKKEMFLKYLMSLETTYPFVHYAGYNGKNKVSVHIASKQGEDRENLEKVLETITTECRKYQLHTCCENCGRKGDVFALVVDGSGHVFCEKCASQLIVGLKEQKEEHILRGFAGSVIGAVLGSLLWLVIDQFGFIAGIAGYAIVYGSISGYVRLGKNLSKAGVIISIVVSVLTILGVEFVAFGITVYREFKAEYMITLLEAFKSVPGLLMYEEIRSGILKELLIGYAFAVLASFSYVKKIWVTVNAKGAVHTVSKL